MKLNRKAVLAVALVIVILILTYTKLYVPKLAIMSVSEVKIYPKTGSVDPATGEWSGTFWVITGLVNAEETYSFYKFDEAQSKTGDNKVGDKTIVPKATIEVTLTPGQPYYERALRRTPIKVTPRAADWELLEGKFWYRSGEKIVSPMVVDTWQFSELSWNLYTPFTVTVKKTAGQNQFTQTYTDNTIGGVKTFQVVNPYDSKEKLLVTNLGKLGTGYQIALDNVLIVANKDYIFRFSDDLKRTIEVDQRSDSYSYYWYGSQRYTVGTEVEARPPLASWECNNYPGWDLSYMLISPRKPDVFSDDLYSTPKGQSLMNYLLTKGFSLIPKTDIDIWKQGYEITSDNKLKVYLPRASVSSLITMQISTELADSVVYSPIIGEFRITDIKWESGQIKPKISDKQNLYVTVKQIADVTATGTVWTEVSPSTSQVTVTPKTDTITLSKDQTHTFKFEVKNLGVAAETGVKIKFKVTDTYGNVDDENVAECVLVPGEATLVVYTTGETPPNSGTIYVNGVLKTRNYGNQYRESVPVGEYKVSFGDVKGFVAPGPQTVNINVGETKTVVGEYKGAQGKTILSITVKGTDMFFQKPEEATLISDANVTVTYGTQKKAGKTNQNGMVEFDLGTYEGTVEIHVEQSIFSLYSPITEEKTVGTGGNTYTIWLNSRLLMFTGIAVTIVAIALALWFAKRRWRK